MRMLGNHCAYMCLMLEWLEAMFCSWKLMLLHVCCLGCTVCKQARPLPKAARWSNMGADCVRTASKTPNQPMGLDCCQLLQQAELSASLASQLAHGIEDGIAHLKEVLPPLILSQLEQRHELQAWERQVLLQQQERAALRAQHPPTHWQDRGHGGEVELLGGHGRRRRAVAEGKRASAPATASPAGRHRGTPPGDGAAAACHRATAGAWAAGQESGTTGSEADDEAGSQLLEGPFAAGAAATAAFVLSADCDARAAAAAAHDASAAGAHPRARRRRAAHAGADFEAYTGCEAFAGDDHALLHELQRLQRMEGEQTADRAQTLGVWASAGAPAWAGQAGTEGVVGEVAGCMPGLLGGSGPAGSSFFALLPGMPSEGQAAAQVS